MKVFVYLFTWLWGPRAVWDEGVTLNSRVEAKAKEAPESTCPPRPALPRLDCSVPRVSRHGAVTSGLIRVSY